MEQGLVLVTGGSGFIAGHCIMELLAKGYEVRATIRSLAKEPSVRALLTHAGLTRPEALTFVAADLTNDDGWNDATRGVDGILHVASPVQPGHVTDEQTLIDTAREGTLRVLRAAARNGVRRVVLTSAFHAVGWGHPHDDHVFTDDDWTVTDGPGVDAYGRSKTLAERAAWQYVVEEGAPFELVTMLPVAVMGPVIGREISGANEVVQHLLTGEIPAIPDVWLPIVDVRDVAAAHVLGLETPEAAGQRYLLSNGPALAMGEVAQILRAELGDEAEKVPTRKLPSFVIRIAGLFNKEMRAVAPDLGYARRTSNDKARTQLGWQPRPAREAVLAAARSLLTQRP